MLSFYEIRFANWKIISGRRLNPFTELITKEKFEPGSDRISQLAKIQKSPKGTFEPLDSLFVVIINDLHEIEHYILSFHMRFLGS